MIILVEWIKNWVTTICVAVIFITAVELIMPSDKFKKYVQFVMGLILIAVILNPIIQLFDNNSGISVYIGNAEKYFNSAAYDKNYSKYKTDNKQSTLINFKSNLENTCVKILKEKYPENDYEVSASAEYKDNEIKIRGLDISLKNNTVKKIEKIQINSTMAETDKGKELSNEMSRKIKTYLKEQLKVAEDVIHVYQ